MMDYEIQRLCKKTGELVERELYQHIMNNGTDSPKMGAEVRIKDYGTYQVIFKIKKEGKE